MFKLKIVTMETSYGNDTIYTIFNLNASFLLLIKCLELFLDI